MVVSVSECLHADEEWTWRRDVFEKRSSAEATSLEVTAMRRRGVKWRGPRDGLQVEIELLWEPENTEKSVYATKGSTVYVHYTGRLSSGAVFDATRSKSDGTPFRFVVGGGKVTDGFERGVSMTRLGCVSRIRVANAYPRGVPGSIEPGASLVFDVFVAQVDDEKADEEPPVLVRGEPADLLSDSWGPSKETRSFASFTRKNKDVQEVGKPVPRRKKNSTAWTGTDDVSSTGLCVVEDALGDLESMLLARWTWSELCESDWANEQLGLAKYKAPIDSNKDKLIDCPVVEIPLADFARYCLRLARDDNSAFNEARYYLNGWEPLANEDARVWGGGPMPQIDNFPHVQDLSRRLLLEYEKQTNARLFGSKDTNAASLAEKTADSASKHLTKAFVGPTGSTTRLHQDNHGAHARLTVLKGRKLYVAFSPLDEEYLYVQNGHSSVDFLDPDLEEYPLYARATPYAAIVEEGQTLLVPKNWFHAAVSLTPTLTIMRNFWTVSNLQDFSDMQSSQLRRKLALLREAGLIRSA